MIKKLTLLSFLTAVLIFSVQIASAVSIIIVPTPEVPTDKNQCKKGGWRDFGDMFKNQGDCVSFVVTGGKNAPDGPPIH